MTKSGYAKHRGVSPAMVTKWKDSGRLVLRGAKVDVAATDALLGAVLDRERGGKRDRIVSGAQDSPPQGEAPSGGGAGHDPGSPPRLPEGVGAVVTATVAAKEADAAWKRARTDRELGKLVDRGAYEAAAEAAAAVFRTGLANLSARLGTAVAEALGVDARKVFPILEDEARRIANEVADELERLADAAGAA